VNAALASLAEVARLAGDPGQVLPVEKNVPQQAFTPSNFKSIGSER
jgi:hypothetical protein